jgi:thiosulfate dehydrogenase [quinone] large subunit
MTRADRRTQPRTRILPDPEIVRDLTATVRFSWVWLAIRVYLGWDWLLDGWAKLQSSAWMSGEELRIVWLRSTAADPVAGSTHGWYSAVLRFLLRHGSEVWLGRAIAISETLLGIAMILGLFTAVVAVVGSLLGVNAAVVGAGLANPLTIGLAFLLVLAWKTAGWIGFDRWVLPALGAPWESRVLRGRGDVAPTHAALHTEVLK